MLKETSEAREELLDVTGSLLTELLVVWFGILNDAAWMHVLWGVFLGVGLCVFRFFLISSSDFEKSLSVFLLGSNLL